MFVKFQGEIHSSFVNATHSDFSICMLRRVQQPTDRKASRAPDIELNSGTTQNEIFYTHQGGADKTLVDVYAQPSQETVVKLWTKVSQNSLLGKVGNETES